MVDFDGSLSIAALEDLVAEYDEIANGIPAAAVEVFDDTPRQWRCIIDPSHAPWRMSALEAVASLDAVVRCPLCRSSGVKANAMAFTRPDLALLLVTADPRSVTANATEVVEWRCSTEPSHETYWMPPRNRSALATDPCPSCYGPTAKWSEERLLAFVRDLDPTDPALGPAQLFAICQQNGLLRSRKGTLVANALIHGQVRELDDLLGGRVLDVTTRASSSTEGGSNANDTSGRRSPLPHRTAVGDLDEATAGAADHSLNPGTGADPGPAATGTLNPTDLGTGSLPGVSTRALLTRLGTMVANCDEETADYLAASAVRVLWEKAYELDRLQRIPAAERTSEQSEQVAALSADLSAQAVPDNAFSQTIWERFSGEHQAALDLEAPADWAFTPVPSGPVAAPNLMQRHVAATVRDRRRYGNWSGTGAGKTVSAVLGASLIGAGHNGIVLVICPNNTVDGWAHVVGNCFRDARVQTKTFTPAFGGADLPGARWLILNYDRLPGNEATLRGLIERVGIDMLIVDEVHYVKHRAKADMSQRRRVLTGIATMARILNPDLAVLAMSATPVVNDLHEARSLLELIEGDSLDDVGVSPTINDAMSIHQRIVRNGTRWMPTYSANLDVVSPRIDIGHLAEDLRALGKGATPLAVEQMLIEAKLDTIIAECRDTQARGKRALIYTQFVDGLLDTLAQGLEDAGLRVGFFTGGEKDGLARVRGITSAGEAVAVREQVDVLIGSEAVGTGVDGLQQTCDTLVFATLPWTHANYMQVVGRIHRQGQAAAQVRVVIPATYIDINDGSGTETWSWDDKAWGRICNKQTLADCAVDGVVPSKEMVTPGEATRAHLAWLARLMEGKYATVERAPLEAELGQDVAALPTATRAARFSELTRMNGVWGAAHSAAIHERLADDPTEWHNYHCLYRAARLTWGHVPALVFADWLSTRPAGQRIADLGCGEMILADAASGTNGETIADRHDVDAFDHVAADERVQIADIADLPVPDGTYDYAVLSLALMGANHTDYVRQAHRILRADGQLWLCEPTSHLGTDEASLRERFAAFGFDVANIQVLGQFTFVRAVRADRAPTANPTARIKISVTDARAAGLTVRRDADATTQAAGDAIIKVLLNRHQRLATEKAD